jgi:cytochrome c5
LKRLVLGLLSVVFLAVQGCTMGTSAPPAVSPAVVAAGARSHASPDQLSQGRSLFVARCVECHTLPAVSAYSPDRWRKVLSQMAPRANLQPNDKQAVLAYLVAARTAIGEESRR